MQVCVCVRERDGERERKKERERERGGGEFERMGGAARCCSTLDSAHSPPRARNTNAITGREKKKKKGKRNNNDNRVEEDASD